MYENDWRHDGLDGHCYEGCPCLGKDWEMSNTVKIANRVMDKGKVKGMSPEAVKLGILAAQCEEWAMTEPSKAQKKFLLEQAEEYREQQAIVIQRDRMVEMNGHPQCNCVDDGRVEGQYSDSTWSEFFVGMRNMAVVIVMIILATIAIVGF